MSEAQLRDMFRQADDVEPPLPPHFVAGSIEAGRRRLRHRRTVRATTGGVAAVAALAIAATAVVGGTGGTGGVSGVDHGAVGGTPADVPGQHQEVPDAPQNAIALLERVSLVAGQRPEQVRRDQFIYEKRQFSTPVPTEVNPNGEIAGVSESWDSVDGSKPGWTVMPDKRGQQFSGPTPAEADPSLEGNTTYTYLTTLPTDPSALLAKVRTAVAARPGSKPGDRVDADQETFEVIGGVLNNTMLPPRLGAALYQAVAKIPGVTMITEVTDLAGRPGIAVQRVSAQNGDTSRWIFDRRTYEFLGANVSQLTRYRDGDRFATSSFAILTRAVVDEVRQTP
jgi:hypothetical protein